ncbi:SprT-like domain-containing protein [Leeuwenhoekiella palythoae]|uniref:SprT-like family protein n=1 Tax=Leeuwenhoekiella palythoae TaxID=573501 RepID=A0A1M5ZBN4_9FLAO|nr:SprT-like domain-containing protein [Leeuwenhoekiella palythoae]MEC7783305.1 SprT-like domain-containing protein [Bacteroidota bacterium]HAX14408.1 sprT domain-containing protein [Leeuwenhoekiella sp.]MEE3148168.1 SprT-like domain-containing protein [Bacteroidota bacterium]RXG28045.1 SprT-like family protein [Leeuwenhoekiella palythoae]UBZ09351.1 SprT-like domain-containing protein [Leeuwenhoekiella palythoae]|tara:strand:- start:168 stop:764 length:597 start_codon:yes stop_codon:yes gene_type:complete
MKQILGKYIPEQAVDPVFELIKNFGVHLKIVDERVTRHGDYRRLPNGGHQITVNTNLNSYRFLITLIHEIAHLVAFVKFGNRIKPHGKEWKYTFQNLMLPFIRPEIFPKQLLPVIANHFKNPKASSDTDAKLSLALKQFDPPNDKNYIFEIPRGSLFKLYNGKVFQKGERRVKRYECVETATGKVYLFQPNAEVELLT